MIDNCVEKLVDLVPSVVGDTNRLEHRPRDLRFFELGPVLDHARIFADSDIWNTSGFAVLLDFATVAMGVQVVNSKADWNFLAHGLIGEFEEVVPCPA